MPVPEVSVIIVSFGTRDLTLAALESVREASAVTRLEAIVVDNASPDDSASAISRDHPWAQLIASPQNRGFGAGANLGARAARGTWLLFLNSDARLPSGALTSLLRAGETLASPGALGPRIVNAQGLPERSAGHFFGPWRDFVQAFRLYRLFAGVRRFEGITIPPGTGSEQIVDWVSGACLLVQRKFFESLGGFDESYFLYVEDMDLCYRLRHYGRINYYVPSIVVEHELGKSRRPDSPILIDGGKGPEYFAKKFELRYPVLLQRTLRAINMLVWLSRLKARILISRWTGKDASEDARMASICSRSIKALFWSS
jgi:GT2 family glycosyltransferase